MTAKTHRTVRLIGVPSDLGANTSGARMGPSALRIAGLQKALEELGIEVDDCGDLEVYCKEAHNSKKCPPLFDLIFELCKNLHSKTLEALDQGTIPITLGGDHSLAMGSISAVLEHCRGRRKKLGVLWIDAHADINDLASSPSGNLHGMPVSYLLGKSRSTYWPEIHNHELKPNEIIQVGLRNLDLKEKTLLKDSGVCFYTMRDVDELGVKKVMEECAEYLFDSCDHIHVSFDLDGCDPRIAPGVSTPVLGGLNFRESHLILETLADTGKIGSLDLVELNPINDIANTTAKLGVDLLLSALGKSII